MHPTKPLSRLLLACCVAASPAFGVCAELLAKEPVPQVSPEGLQLQARTDARRVYLKPGATLDQYDRVAIADTYVEFAKDWQRGYNSNATGGLAGRVTTQDMDRMKAAVATEFKKVFTQELSKGGYQVVDAAAPDVLSLRPAIIDLRVTAPDLMKSGRNQTAVRSAGRMTLYLELWDSATNTILARILDPQEDRGIGGIANRASNKAAMDNILEEWAQELRMHLDAARGKPAGTR